MCGHSATTTWVWILVGELRIEFDHTVVTGQEIKERASVPLDWDLVRRRGGGVEVIANDRTLEVKEGERFEALPPGTVS